MTEVGAKQPGGCENSFGRSGTSPRSYAGLLSFRGGSGLRWDASVRGWARFHLRGRILIGGGDARVDPGGHEPRLVGRTKTRSHGRPSPFCLRLGCDLVCGHRPPHTGRGWQLRETMTKVVRLAGVEPATLGLEGRGKRELGRDVTAGLPRLTRTLLGAGGDSYCIRTELSDGIDPNRSARRRDAAATTRIETDSQRYWKRSR